MRQGLSRELRAIQSVYALFHLHSGYEHAHAELRDQTGTFVLCPIRRLETPLNVFEGVGVEVRWGEDARFNSSSSRSERTLISSVCKVWYSCFIESRESVIEKSGTETVFGRRDECMGRWWR